MEDLAPYKPKPFNIKGSNHSLNANAGSNDAGTQDFRNIIPQNKPQNKPINNMPNPSWNPRTTCSLCGKGGKAFHNYLECPMLTVWRANTAKLPQDMCEKHAGKKLGYCRQGKCNGTYK